MNQERREQWRQAITVADQLHKEHRELLDKTLREAHAAGIGYSTLAGWLGLTEGAVRLRFKRKGWDGI